MQMHGARRKSNVILLTVKVRFRLLNFVVKTYLQPSSHWSEKFLIRAKKRKRRPTMVQLVLPTKN